MKPPKSTLILAILLFTTSLVFAQQKMSSVKIYPPTDPYQRAELIGSLEIDHFQTLEDGAILAELDEKEMLRLKTSGIRHTVVVNDIAAHLYEVNRKYYEDRAAGIQTDDGRLAFEQTGKTVSTIFPTPSRFEVKSTFGGYYRYQEMEDAIDTLVKYYGTGPNAIISKQALSIQTHNGRDIWVVKISDNVGTDESNEPEVLYIGLQHAREAIGGSSMIFFMQYLCENYATDSRVKALVDNREIFIIPCMNPDGWEYNYTLNSNGGGGWRKNRRNNGSGNYGVDLNRNWGVDWGNCSAPIQGPASSCGSSSGSSDTYYGPSAFSEPETQAIRDFTYAHHFVAMIDQHSYGPYYSLPFGRPSLPSNVMDPTDANFYTHISSAMGTYNGMRSGNSYEALGYEVAGGVKDWMLRGNIGTGSKGKVYGMTGEGGAGGGTGGSYGSFWPPASQIINLCKGMTFQNLQLAYASGSYIDLQDASDINLSSLTGNFSFNAIRTGIDNQPITVSVVPLENIATVGTLSPFSLTNYGDTYSGNISYTLPGAITSGQRIRFAWKIQTGGITYYDTVTKFYNATQLLYDNMNGSYGSNWTSNPSSGAWGFTSSGTGFGGTGKAMSESPSGNYSANVTRTSTYNSTFNLSDATAAYLTFWTKHRAENFRDKLQVQVSTNGSTWTAIAGSTTIQEPGTLDGSTINGQPALTGVRVDWARELFDLSGYLGASAVRLRFVFTSDASTSFAFAQDDGFYIDELKVVKSTAALITLPVNFISFNAKMTSLNTVALDWQAEVDTKFNRFIVEKSTDGQNFVSIGTVLELPYKMEDLNPAVGINYYRIKEVDNDGRFTYSKVNTVNFNPTKFSMIVYPNPAKENITFRVTTESPESVIIQVTDLSGRVMYSDKQMIGAGNHDININVQSWSAQTYVVKAIRSDNTYLSIQKFIKQ